MLHVVSCCLSLIYYLYQLETNLAFPGVTLCFGLATGLEGHGNHHKIWEVSGIIKKKQLNGRAKKKCKNLSWCTFTTFTTFITFTFSKSLDSFHLSRLAFGRGAWAFCSRNAGRDRDILVLGSKISESFPDCTRTNKKKWKYDSTVQYALMSLIPSQSNKLYVYTCMYCQKISQPPQRTVAPSGCCNRACHGSRLPRRVSSATLQVGSQSRVRGGGRLGWDCGVMLSCCFRWFSDDISLFTVCLRDVLGRYGLSDVFGLLQNYGENIDIKKWSQAAVLISSGCHKWCHLPKIAVLSVLLHNIFSSHTPLYSTEPQQKTTIIWHSKWSKITSWHQWSGTSIRLAVDPVQTAVSREAHPGP